MRFRNSLLTLLLLSTLQVDASATSTVCSNPKRARVLDSANVALPNADFDAFEKTFNKLVETLGMTTWAVAFRKDGRNLTSKTVGLQSPKVSVGINTEWKVGQKKVKIIVERTCYSDDLEPWEGYWSKFLEGLKGAGYKSF
jgi:hypothetical protein